MTTATPTQGGPCALIGDDPLLLVCDCDRPGLVVMSERQYGERPPTTRSRVSRTTPRSCPYT